MRLFLSDGNYLLAKENTHTNGFCCTFPKEDPNIKEWRNQDMLQELNIIDGEWRQYIGWVPFFNASVSLSDMREEYNFMTNKPDCTHFIYTPFAFSVLWKNIERAVDALHLPFCQ